MVRILLCSPVNLGWDVSIIMRHNLLGCYCKMHIRPVISPDCVCCGDWGESIALSFFHFRLVCLMWTSWRLHGLHAGLKVLYPSSISSNVTPLLDKNGYCVFLLIWHYENRDKEFHEGKRVFFFLTSFVL